jgi:Flp pilus assembly protein TadD
MDDKQHEAGPEPAADEAAQRKKLNARLRGMTIFLVILAVPVLIGGWLVIRVKRQMAAERSWAEAELKKPAPDPQAYGVLGSQLLSDGRTAEAEPLLKRAAELEAQEGKRVTARVLRAEALLEGLKKGLPGFSRDEAAKVVSEIEAVAPKLPQGRAAAAWHAAGKLWIHVGEREKAVKALAEAVRLQQDDWVDEGEGRRYKSRGVASIYAKDLAGAAQEQR